MKIKNWRLQPHRYLWMATRRSFEKDRGGLGWRQQQGIRVAMHKRRHRLIIGVDAADGIPAFILQRGKGSPFVNRPFRAGARRPIHRQRHQPRRNQENKQSQNRSHKGIRRKPLGIYSKKPESHPTILRWAGASTLAFHWQPVWAESRSLAARLRWIGEFSRSKSFIRPLTPGAEVCKLSLLWNPE